MDNSESKSGTPEKTPHFFFSRKNTKISEFFCEVLVFYTIFSVFFFFFNFLARLMYFSCNLANTEYLATIFCLNYLSLLFFFLQLSFGCQLLPQTGRNKTSYPGRYWSVDCRKGRCLPLLIYRPEEKGAPLQHTHIGSPGSSAYIRVVKGDELGSVE